MKPQTAISPEAPILQALARGVCPICTLMRVVQNAMIGAPHLYPATTLCNFHAWSLAGSSPAVEAVPIFRSMLEGAAVTLASDPMELHPCNWCVALREHEDEKLAEFTREMKGDNFRTWVSQYGTVCRFHGRRLLKVLPEPEAEIIRHILASNREELERQLAAFDARVRRGEKGGGGVLGHIAEFLVSQRGITR
jgi:hypothetical protein